MLPGNASIRLTSKVYAYNLASALLIRTASWKDAMAAIFLRDGTVILPTPQPFVFAQMRQ